MYNENFEEIKYILYARKSEESEDRQVQSIDDQIRLMKKIALDLNLNIVEILKESKSAKDPGRPEFNKMLNKIESGEANGVLCWQINRLTRNPIDSGKLQYLLQNEFIKSIRCSDKQYLPNDNTLIFSVETGVANQFILDLKKNTKRGLQTKLEKGWLPGPAPIGYLNDKYEEQGNKKILIDEERFQIVRKMWDLMLTGNYNVKQICKIASEEYGLRTVQKKKRGGVKLSYSGTYRVFTNKFYAGIMVRNGREYKGAHKPMISLGEFYKVQEILRRREKPMAHIHEFPYTGFIRCGNCGAMITAEEKVKVVKSSGLTKIYKYYRCTRKKMDIDCKEKSLTEKQLEDQFKNLLLKCKILPKFKDWALEILKEMNDGEINDRNKIYTTQNNNLNDLQKQLDNLTTLRIKELITDEEYLTKKQQLKKDLEDINILLEKTKYRAENWIDRAEKIFNYMVTAYEDFNNMGFLERKNILRDIGQKFTLKDGEVSLDKTRLFIEMENNYPKLEDKYLRLELDKTLDDKEKIELLHSIKSVWGGIRGSNP